MISVIHHRNSDDCDIKRGRQMLRRVRFGRSGAGNLDGITASDYVAAAIARVRLGDEEVRHYWRCPVLGWVDADGLACAPPPFRPAPKPAYSRKRLPVLRR